MMEYVFFFVLVHTDTGCATRDEMIKSMSINCVAHYLFSLWPRESDIVLKTISDKTGHSYSWFSRYEEWFQFTSYVRYAYVHTYILCT